LDIITGEGFNKLLVYFCRLLLGFLQYSVALDLGLASVSSDAHGISWQLLLTLFFSSSASLCFCRSTGKQP
jgi:hypothetical protein